MCLRMARRPPGGAALLGQLARERLDQLEDGGNLALVARQHHALRQRVRDDDQMLGRARLERDRAAGKDLLVPVRRDHDIGDLLLAAVRPGERGARHEALQHLVLFRRRKPDQDRHAIAKQHRNPDRPGRKGQRHHREHVAALEPGRIQPIPHKQRSRGHARAAARRLGGDSTRWSIIGQDYHRGVLQKKPSNTLVGQQRQEPLARNPLPTARHSLNLPIFRQNALISWISRYPGTFSATDDASPDHNCAVFLWQRCAGIGDLGLLPA